MLTVPLINCMIGNKSNRWDDGPLLPYSNKAFSHSKHKVLLSVLLLSVIVFSILFLVLPFAEGLVVDYNPNIGEGKTINHSSFPSDTNTQFWCMDVKSDSP